ncbi:conserved hypothetical protein [Gloeothece citriformis PCC 7424]|uniref:Uncharacterized protein n=1 Tax=Gloeothece citriformis (strain PCC 7424) TaxID=65393 RepID=B7KAX1_GLOC7|nr:COP23 domain-containing protein [Gloeothece citriformis]ACK70081.1 conserved hypothetical protein [Gloeothece citriformis PCC 7424]
MMKKNRLMQIISLIVLSVSHTLILSQPSHSQNTRFFCAVLNQTYTTFVRTPRGNKPLILWTSGSFDAEGWTNEKRCLTVSGRLEKYNKSGTLKYMRPDKINNYPVICIAAYKGGKCANHDVLITLKQGTNANDILSRLTAINQLAGARPVHLNDEILSYDDSGNLYVDMELYIKAISEATENNNSDSSPF